MPATSDSAESGGEATEGWIEEDGFAWLLQRDVDILFVIDDSASMAEEQRKLAASLPVFIAALESPDASANYRIAFTTTDAGNPSCDFTGAEPGDFVITSCRSRLDASENCLDACPPEWTEIDLAPTRVRGSSAEIPRPWIESVDSYSNLPAGLSVTQAVQCIAPQGTDGCDFTSPLEATRAVFGRTLDAESDEFGFLRDNAVLAVVVVTDAADCSYDPEWESIFLPSGDRAFWSLPDADAPTPAVCWNAGVTCEPEGAEVFDHCVVANKDIAGDLVSDAGAVLHPVDLYVELLQESEDAKQALNPAREVVFAAIAGVPVGYPEAPIVYASGANGSDPASFQAQFGIGPGCESAHGDAVPPVRLAAVADAFAIGTAETNVFSVCDTSYASALTAIAKQITDQLPVLCMLGCAADLDPLQGGLQPECRHTMKYRDEYNRLIEVNLPECNPGDALPEGADACVSLLGDPGGVTPTLADDLQPQCIARGWNLGLRVIRRPAAIPLGADILTTCTSSTNPSIDCPNLPG